MPPANNIPVDRAIKALGQSLALAHRRRGLSQADLASRREVSTSTARRLGMTPQELQAFAPAFEHPDVALARTWVVG